MSLSLCRTVVGAIDGVEVERFAFGDPSGVEITMLSYGATVQSLRVPDRDGVRASVVLGLSDLAGYETVSPYFGATVGRYANRIGGAAFSLDGSRYELSANDHGNTLHGGGPAGFSHRVWSASAIEAPDRVGVRFGLVSADGDNGFPGQVRADVSYTVDAAGEVRIDYHATTDAPTVVNLTNHSYFHLGGEGTGSALGHVLMTDADRYVPVDDAGIPGGPVESVEDTPFDFRAPAVVGERIRSGHPQLLAGLGYDHCLVFTDGGRRMRLADPTSGRTMDVTTDQPGVQVYTGNKLTGSIRGIGGRTYRQGDGIALETQALPDSPNRPDFPSTVLRPGQDYRTTTTWRFGVE